MVVRSTAICLRYISSIYSFRASQVVRFSSGPLEAYEKRIANGKLQRDNAQDRVVRRLQVLHEKLVDTTEEGELPVS
jgi:predicted ATPase